MDERPPLPVRLVIGLGNPGARYALTRHNVGFMVAEVLAMRCRAEFSVRLPSAVAAQFTTEHAESWIAKPLCFMNRSGRAVRELLANCGDADAGILVIYDDFHLPLGRIRFRAKGSAGGQNGVKSIIETLGTEDFHRLRIGIGEPPPFVNPADFVLEPVPLGERDQLRDVIDLATEGADAWLRTGDIQGCMNQYN